MYITTLHWPDFAYFGLKLLLIALKALTKSRAGGMLFFCNVTSIASSISSRYRNRAGSHLSPSQVSA
jgi:hypothetical protein